MAEDKKAPKPDASPRRDPRGRFQPGYTANAKGRPPKGNPTSWSEAVRRAEDRKVQVSDGGPPRAMTKREIAATQLVNQSAAGDKGAIKLSAQLSREAEARALQAPLQHSEADLDIIGRLVRRIRNVEI